MQNKVNGLMTLETEASRLADLKAKLFTPKKEQSAEEWLGQLTPDDYARMQGKLEMYRLAMRARRYSEPYLTYAELLGEMYPRWSSQDAVMIKQILDELDPAQEKCPMIETTEKLSTSQALIDKYTLPEITDEDVDRYADSLELDEQTKAKLIRPKPTHTKDDFLDRLVMSESSGKADAEITIADGRRFVGKLQFGDARLQDYSNSTGETFTQDEFIQDTALQDKVAAWHLADLDKAIDALGNDAAEYDRDGLRAVGHLGGKGGMRQFVKSKGDYNPADDLGFPVNQG